MDAPKPCQVITCPRDAVEGSDFCADHAAHAPSNKVAVAAGALALGLATNVIYEAGKTVLTSGKARDIFEFVQHWLEQNSYSSGASMLIKKPVIGDEKALIKRLEKIGAEVRQVEREGTQYWEVIRG